MTEPLFNQHPRKGFVVGWKKGKLVLRDSTISTRTDAICSRKRCVFVVFNEIFWTSMASELKCFYSTALGSKLANIYIFFH